MLVGGAGGVASPASLLTPGGGVAGLQVVTSCPVTTHLGLPCDPGLAYNTLSRSCEWPDTLLDAGCNPERECCVVIQSVRCSRDDVCSDHGVRAVPPGPRRPAPQLRAAADLAIPQVSAASKLSPDSRPLSRFPVNLDVVTAHNFDAFLAKKYFIICVPTVYGRWFPRLIHCPDNQVSPQ